MTAKQSNSSFLNSSFRDPAGVMFTAGGVLYRQINQRGMSDYTLSVESGLLDSLTKSGLLIPHKNASNKLAVTNDAAKVIKPTLVPIISYPFEWSFSQLKDAALTTLAIQKQALGHEMSLKDASAYNIQFYKGKPIFIDTLSFEKLKPNQPWQAYGQFCRHFLAPLLLMSYNDIRLKSLLQEYIDGVPLDLTVKLLPKRAKIKPSIAMHIVLHAKAQKNKQSSHKKPQTTVSKNNLLAILSSLERLTLGLKPKISQTEWKNYYSFTNYSDKAAKSKEKILRDFQKQIPRFNSLLDLGGNNGHYSRLFSKQNIDTVCVDIDPFAVEDNYLNTKKQNENSLLPLLINLVNPAGAMGWANSERAPITERLKADVVMALALVHHLAISNNLPLEKIAEYFSKFGQYLIIEFVPKEDSQVQKLLSTREDIFPNYTAEGFEQAFKTHYRIINTQQVKYSERTLYLLKRVEK